MNWNDKLTIIRQTANLQDELAIVFDTVPPAPLHFVEALHARYPYAPREYLDFLSTSDGMFVWTFVFCGSGQSWFRSLDAMIDLWTDTLHPAVYLPIGYDAAGNCIAIHRDGSIVLFGVDPPSVANQIQLAPSFAKLLNDYMFGNRFYDLFAGSLPCENEWTQFLMNQGWLVGSRGG